MIPPREIQSDDSPDSARLGIGKDMRTRMSITTYVSSRPSNVIVLDRVSQEKDLGILTNDHLEFGDHIAEKV